ncbi:MAG: flagellar hook-associated protein FlgK [Thermodesulfobacterium sp.]|nr:flagellar hook-associated protein FlgK [Thermodesulfobacterium sp.]
MAGLTGALNIAKNSLLAFQLATQVIGHNISNVNNETYSRQKVIETTYPPSPSPVGSIGTGVRIESIKRFFDTFLERNINLKYTDFGLFKAEEEGLTVLESLFNEVIQGVGFTETLRNFWNSWQTLATNPENFAARTQVLEYGKLITELFKGKFQTLKDLETHIKLKLKTLVDKINTLSSQIAQLNLQVIALEAGGKSANDLRDQRDSLIRELSQLVSIQYFESKEGAYNVIIGRGFNLVNIDRTWKIEISGTDIYWIDTQGNKIPLTSREVASGELGGWLRLIEQLSDSYNYEYVSGNRTIYVNGNIINEGTTFSELGLLNPSDFTINGTDHFGTPISNLIINVNPNTTLREFLDEIERAYNFTIRAYIKDGRIFIEDKFRGPGKLNFSVSGPLDLGTFDNPAYQRRVIELNLTGKLKLFGEELLKAVNELHTQGVGLTFYTKELEGAYFVNKYLKELPYFLDLAKNQSGTEFSGFFYLWVKDPQERIIPVKVSMEGLGVDATLEDLASKINEALEEVGFNNNLEALVRNGRLVIQAEDHYAFAFSNDTSGILLSAGLNLFFVGTEPEEININPHLIYKPQLLASGKMDLNSFKTETPLFGVFKSTQTVNPNQSFDNSLSKIYLKLYDDKVNQVSLFSINPRNEKVFFILGKEVGEETRLADLGFLAGTFLNFSGSKYDGSPIGPITFNINPFTTIKDLMKTIENHYDNTVRVYLKDGIFVIENKLSGESNLSFLSNELIQNPIFGANYKWSLNSSEEYFIEVPIEPGEVLSKILKKIDRLPYIRAYIDAEGYAIVELEPNQNKVYALEVGDNSTANGFVDFLNTQRMYLPAFRGDPKNSITRIITGFEDYPFTSEEDYLSFYLFNERGQLIHTFRINLEEFTNPSNNKTLFDLIRKINASENALYGLMARLDRQGKMIIETTGLYQTKTFIIQDEYSRDGGQTFVQTPKDQGFINYLRGYEFKRGDNRTAQAIADLSSAIREKLNYSNLENYYSSMVGEIGAVTKAVKENKNFLEALLSQLKAIRDGISGVSLDEEMANLIKYQQAFTASAKLLSTVEEMFENLIAAKR